VGEVGWMVGEVGWLWIDLVMEGWIWGFLYN
jgi:hypothetical protein